MLVRVTFPICLIALATAFGVLLGIAFISVIMDREDSAGIKNLKEIIASAKNFNELKSRLLENEKLPSKQSQDKDS